MSEFKSGYVAIIGQPNVGKSTLLNAILGERLAIVTHKPQTTRHRITGIYNNKDCQIVFLDTPGYHQSDKPLNVAMLEVVEGVIDDADVGCLMVEPRTVDRDLDRSLFERIGAEKCVIIINKADMVDENEFKELAEKMHNEWGAKEVIVMSALKAMGVAVLVDAIRNRLPEGPAYFPQDEYTDLNMRFIAAEIIREQVFLQMHQEIPYSAAVKIERFHEPRGSERITEIAATIVVEKDSQKGMVIGKQGARIKDIGKKARAKIEELVGGKVFLELNVRVEKNWTKDEKRLRELGYKIVGD
jgi:GTP-binding protein Era